MRRLLAAAALALAGCASPAPRSVAPAPEDPRLCIRILYVLDDGSVYRCDALASAAGQRNFREVRAERDETFTRYSFTLHAEGPDRWWTSL